MTVAVEKPVVVLIHGSWHRPVHFLNLILQLRTAGYTVVAPASPTAGWGPDVVNATLKDAAMAIKAAFQPYLDAGKEVVLVGHSFGGLLTTESAAGETIVDRKARGLKGGVKTIFYLAALVALEAELSLAQMTGQDKPDNPSLPEWFELKNGLILLKEVSKEYLYNDIEEGLAEVSLNGTVPQSSVATLESRFEIAARDVKVPKVYIVCEDDRAVPLEQQLGFAKEVGAKVTRIPGGHSPFLTTEGSARIVSIIAEG